MENKSFLHRYVILGVFLFAFILLFAVRLFNLQIINGDEYRQSINDQTERSYPIKASRGEILDAYGRPLITNRMGYYIRIQDVGADDIKLNETIEGLLGIMRENNEKVIDDFPINADNEFVFKDSKDVKASTSEWKKENKFSDKSAKKIMYLLEKKYKVSGDYDKQTRRDIIAIRFRMEKSNFDVVSPYTFATDISMDSVQKISEQSFKLSGVSVEVEPIRQYVNGNMAAHILGRTDIIYAEEYEKLKDKGYGMNDVIGKDGLEKELEPYLKGKDGVVMVKQNKKGGVEQVLSEKPPKTDNYAVLTIDSKLQAATEKALQENIAAARAGKGYDAYSGAAIAVDVKNSAVLAIASYPDYNPEEYKEKFTELSRDKTKPLFNRALDGAFTPGSTFKPLTAIAALEEGKITPTSTITCEGVYKYFAPSFMPTCLIWKSGRTHGAINVSQAIGVSCNYFFYEAGRRVGIENLNKYAKEFGLGEKTGIELSEAQGIVAGPAYREKIGSRWYPGDTVQAAIGQSDNMFTPAQLASYVTTILNHGKRRSLHIIKEVREYDTDKIVYQTEPKVLSDAKISDKTLEAVKDGMRRVAEDGTASAVFDDFPIEVAGKTGTAEVGSGSDNVLFVGFAPYDNPQIAVAVVIEHGASSRFAAKIAKEMFASYLGTYEVADGITGVNTLLR